MTLGFTTIINGQANFFVEKIWQSIFETVKHGALAEDYANYLFKYKQRFGREWELTQEDVKPKLHTVRRAKRTRWNAGNDIHFVVNNRTSDRFQFAPVLKCTAVQEIEITPPVNKQPGVVRIDGKKLDKETLEIFSWNDGFNNADDLFAYFDKPFKGQLVHWTGLSY